MHHQSVLRVRGLAHDGGGASVIYIKGVVYLILLVGGAHDYFIISGVN